MSTNARQAVVSVQAKGNEREGMNPRREVDMHNPTKRERRWRRLHVAVYALTVALGLATSAHAVVRVTVVTTDGVAGGMVVLNTTLTRDQGDPNIATVQADLIFNTMQIQLMGTCPSGGMCQTNNDCPDDELCQVPCEKNPSLTEQTFDAVVPDFQNVPMDFRRVRLDLLPVFDPPLPVRLIPDGELWTCTFQVPLDASQGPLQLSSDPIRFQVSNDMATPVPATIGITPGSIVTATVTATLTPTGGTLTPTPSETPTTMPTSATPTNTSTVSPTSTPTIGTPTITPTSGTGTPTHSATMGPSNTPTTPSGGGTPTNTPTIGTPANTATQTPTGGTPGPNFVEGDDGCNCRVHSDGSGPGTGWLRWAMPVAALLWLRRRRR